MDGIPHMQDADRKIFILIFVIATLLILLLLGFIMSILFLHRKKQQNFSIELEKVKTNYEKELLKTQLEIQEQTFTYISQEIHDNIGQFISLAKLHLNTLNFANPDAARKQVTNSTDMLTRALDDLRDLSKSLSSEIIKNGGLTKAIEQQVLQLKKLEIPEVVYEIHGDYQFMDEQKEIFILRILQEAINNMIRHAEATRIEIILSYVDNNLSLLIRDNGKGFDTSTIKKSSSSGIGNMMKRAKMIGAVYEIQSVEQLGTSITITIAY
jgi:two-component system NarL family sensor kinase